VSFESSVKQPSSPAAAVAGHSSLVTISQVVTEVDVVSRSSLLEATLASGRFTEFCDRKISLSNDKADATVWSFLKVIRLSQ